MKIRLKSTGQVMYLQELRSSLSNVSGPLDHLYDPIFEGPQPILNQYQTAYIDGIQEIEGKWYTKYSIAEMDDISKANIDQKQAAIIRSYRDKKLSECDWTQLSDAPVDKNKWLIYRQALRDITTQSNFPWDIVWPNSPE